MLKDNFVLEELVYLDAEPTMTVQIRKYVKIENVKAHASKRMFVERMPYVQQLITEKSVYALMVSKGMRINYAPHMNAEKMRIVNLIRSVVVTASVEILVWNIMLVVLTHNVAL